MRDDFVIFILTHGRADNVRTNKALKRAGYTGKIIYVIDNEDKTAQMYYDIFGKENVYMFNKTKKALEIDSMDLSDDRRAIVYARNACFDIAKELGYTYFLELDDDYFKFRSRIFVDGMLTTLYVKDFNKLVDIMLEFLDVSGANTIAMSQTGDFIGGLNSKMYRDRLSRKAMNSFFCRTDRPLIWSGRMNEDVNAYITLGSRGYLFLTVADVSVDQLETQSISGGMAESYAESGTYVKTFYTIMSSPSSVKVYMVGPAHKRFHHRIDWETAVPKIISSKYKKGE